MKGKFQTQLFVIILVISSMGMLGAISYVIPNVANSQSIILSNLTSVPKVPSTGLGSIVISPDNQIVSETSADPLSLITMKEGAFLKIKTNVEGACSNITSFDCRDEFGFDSTMYTNILNNVQKTTLPGSEQGWTLTYFPNTPMEYIVKPSQFVPGNITYSISTSDECIGVLKIQDNKTCTIKYTPLELM